MPQINDQQLLAVFQALEDFLAAQEDLGSALKDGLFSIARGKYALGHELGEQRYPGDMQATSIISVVPAADPDAIYDRFELQQLVQQPAGPAGHQAAAERHASPTGRHAACRDQGDTGQSKREQQQQQQQQAGCVHNHHGHVQHDPVSWFAALPPPPVKQAQKDFGRAVQHVVAAANALQRLRQHAADLQPHDTSDSAESAAADG